MADRAARGAMVVFTAPSPGTDEAAFNAWYDGTHVPEILAKVPGVISARRYRLNEISAGTGAHPFLAVYELDRPSAEVRANLGGLSTSDVLDLTVNPPKVLMYDLIATHGEESGPAPDGPAAGTAG